MWTLVPADRLVADAAGASLSSEFGQAYMFNEMGLVGDEILGTEAPLVLRLVPEETGCRVASDGNVQFTIGAAHVRAGDSIVTDPREQELAWQLAFFGRWPMGDPCAITNEDGVVDAVEYTLDPGVDADAVEDPGFQVIGALSEIISRKFIHLTGTPEDDPQRLRPARVSANRLSLQIPREYKGKALRLWRFTQAVTNATGEAVNPREIPR